MRQPTPRVVKVERKQTPVIRMVEVIMPRLCTRTGEAGSRAAAVVAQPLGECMAQRSACVTQQCLRGRRPL
jgi:hypothetical protein